MLNWSALSAASPPDEVTRHVHDPAGPRESQGSGDSVAQVVQDMVDATLTAGGEPIEVGTSRHAGTGAESDRLGYIAATAHSPVAQDFDAVADRVRNGGDEFKHGRGTIELPPAVIGEAFGWTPVFAASSASSRLCTPLRMIGPLHCL